MADGYATVPIAFEVRAVVDITSAPIAGDVLTLVDRAVSPWVVKDYDAVPDEGPRTWPTRFALAQWALFAAYQDSIRVGGAAIVRATPEIELLDGRRDPRLPHEKQLLWYKRLVETDARVG